MERKVIQSITLTDKHSVTQNTVHYIGGKIAEKPHTLLIVKYENDTGYYLIHLDAKGEEITDTYHENIENAIEQANWEFNILPNQWVIL